MSAPSGAAGRVVRNVHHGSQVVPAGTIGPDDTALRAQVVAMDAALPGRPDEPVAEHDVVFETPFDYLFDKLAAEFPAHHLDDTDPATTVARLKALGTAMTEEDAPPGGELQAQGNSTIPPVYTYWGQFIDHDITVNTDNNQGIADVTRADLEADPAAHGRRRPAQRAPAGLEPGLGLRRRPDVPGRHADRRGGHVRRHQTAALRGRLATASRRRDRSRATTSNAICSGQRRSSTRRPSSATAATTRT